MIIIYISLETYSIRQKPKNTHIIFIIAFVVVKFMLMLGGKKNVTHSTISKVTFNLRLRGWIKQKHEWVILMDLFKWSCFDISIENHKIAFFIQEKAI